MVPNDPQDLKDKQSPPNDPSAPAEAPKKGAVAVRMLADHREGEDFYPVDSVQTFSAKKLESLKAAGVVDDNPEAVKYAQELAAAAKKAAEKKK